MKFSPVKFALWALVMVLVLVLFLPMVASMGALFVSIVFGWLSFIQRVWPQVTINWSGVGMVVLCSALILAGLHSLCAWMFAAVAAKVNTGGAVRWRWSWTVALYAGVWLLFGAIMGAVGVAHQVGWLVRSDEPMFRPRHHSAMLRYALRDTARSLATCAAAADWKLDAARREFLKEEANFPAGRQNVFEDLHVLFLGGTNGELAAGLVFHRNPETRAKVGFVLVSQERSGEFQPIGMLPSVLARHQSPTNSAASSADK